MTRYSALRALLLLSKTGSAMLSPPAFLTISPHGYAAGSFGRYAIVFSDHSPSQNNEERHRGKIQFGLTERCPSEHSVEYDGNEQTLGNITERNEEAKNDNAPQLAVLSAA